MRRFTCAATASFRIPSGGTPGIQTGSSMGSVPVGIRQATSGVLTEQVLPPETGISFPSLSNWVPSIRRQTSPRTKRFEGGDGLGRMKVCASVLAATCWPQTEIESCSTQDH